MLPMIPGPSSTDKGLPVLSTGSPTVTPADQELRTKPLWLLLCSVFEKLWPPEISVHYNHAMLIVVINFTKGQHVTADTTMAISERDFVKTLHSLTVCFTRKQYPKNSDRRKRHIKNKFQCPAPLQNSKSRKALDKSCMFEVIEHEGYMFPRTPEWWPCHLPDEWSPPPTHHGPHAPART